MNGNYVSGQGIVLKVIVQLFLLHLFFFLLLRIRRQFDNKVFVLPTYFLFPAMDVLFSFKYQNFNFIRISTGMEGRERFRPAVLHSKSFLTELILHTEC